MVKATAFLLVFLGGGAGSVCRFGLNLLAKNWLPSFPIATLLANGLASFVLGAVLMLGSQNRLSDEARLLLATGFCGGFSTFSTFTAESWGLFQSGQTLLGLANLLGNLVVCFGCFWLGMRLGAT